MVLYYQKESHYQRDVCVPLPQWYNVTPTTHLITTTIGHTISAIKKGT